MARDYKNVIAKVCSVYASAEAPFADLYQEVMINLWCGLETFRGEAQISTWIYRLAINTCITWQRKNSRHYHGAMTVDAAFDVPADDDSRMAEIKQLYDTIGMLDPFDKALITLWLDEKSYDEIALILGISRTNVGTRLHRVRSRLSKLYNQ